MNGWNFFFFFNDKSMNEIVQLQLKKRVKQNDKASIGNKVQSAKFKRKTLNRVSFPTHKSGDVH